MIIILTFFKKPWSLRNIIQKTGKRYTWIEGKSLGELLEQKVRILELAKLRKENERNKNRTWQERLIENNDRKAANEQGCLICSL